MYSKVTYERVRPITEAILDYLRRMGFKPIRPMAAEPHLICSHPVFSMANWLATDEDGGSNVSEVLDVVGKLGLDEDFADKLRDGMLASHPVFNPGARRGQSGSGFMPDRSRLTEEKLVFMTFDVGVMLPRFKNKVAGFGEEIHFNECLNVIRNCLFDILTILGYALPGEKASPSNVTWIEHAKWPAFARVTGAKGVYVKEILAERKKKK